MRRNRNFSIRYFCFAPLRCASRATSYYSLGKVLLAPASPSVDRRDLLPKRSTSRPSTRKAARLTAGPRLSVRFRLPALLCRLLFRQIFAPVDFLTRNITLATEE
jgi:hypothetical protein